MARICSLRKYSRWVFDIALLACVWILACMADTCSSLLKNTFTFRSLSNGSFTSRRAWASSVFSLRFDATRSARRIGSSMLLRIALTSVVNSPRNSRIFSLCSRTLRIKASLSRLSSFVCGSTSFSIFTRWKGFVSRYSATRALAKPCTRSFALPSGSFSIRRIIATVPTPNISPGPGFSIVESRCVARTRRRSLAMAASTARTDLSLPTKSGSTMCIKTTMSRTGRSGSVSGISMGSSSSSITSIVSPVSS